MKKGEIYECVSDDWMNFSLGEYYECVKDEYLNNDKRDSEFIINTYRKDFKLVANSQPNHYKTQSNLDVIDFCNDYKLNFNRGSAIKYIARAGKKEDEIKDLEKAIDFLQREIKFLKIEIH